jgi:hypothetical protein
MIYTPCKHCGKERGKHRAKTFECPLPSRSSFKQFSTTDFYEARNPTKGDLKKAEEKTKFKL